MIIPGFLISLITFPGVIVHELAHQICCRIAKIPVYEVKYFQTQNPCGYVVHERSENPFKNFLIAMGPFLVNTLVGIIMIIPLVVDFNKPFLGYELIRYFLIWIAVSILMHAFPSTGDAKSMVESILKNPEVSILVKIVVAPFVGLVYLGAIGSMFWLDLLYGAGIYFLIKIIMYAIIL